MCMFSRASFTQYIQPSFEAIYKLLDHPQQSIRKVAIEALAQFTVTLFEINDVVGAQKAVAIIVPKFTEILKNDEEIPVALSVFEAYMELLKKLKHQAMYNEELKNHVFSCINDVFCSKVACQFTDNSCEEENQDESEYYVALVESAGDLLPKLGEAMQPAEFALYFGRILPVLVEKLQKAKNNDELQSDRSLTFGALSESFQALQGYTATWYEGLLPIYLAGLQDEYEQARHNAVYGLGELVFYADDKAYNNFPQVLQALSQMVANEEHAGTLDNICGALARLVITNSKLVPLEQVLPVFVQKLPLREDFHENKSIFKCFQVLLTQNDETLLKSLDRIILIGLRVLVQQEYKDDGSYSFFF